MLSSLPYQHPATMGKVLNQSNGIWGTGHRTLDIQRGGGEEKSPFLVQRARLAQRLEIP